MDDNDQKEPASKDVDFELEEVKQVDLEEVSGGTCKAATGCGGACSISPPGA